MGEGGHVVDVHLRVCHGEYMYARTGLVENVDYITLWKMLFCLLYLQIVLQICNAILKNYKKRVRFVVFLKLEVRSSVLASPDVYPVVVRARRQE